MLGPDTPRPLRNTLEKTGPGRKDLLMEPQPQTLLSPERLAEVGAGNMGTETACFKTPLPQWVRPLKIPFPPWQVPRLGPSNVPVPQEPQLPSLQASPEDELLGFTS